MNKGCFINFQCFLWWDSYWSFRISFDNRGQCTPIPIVQSHSENLGNLFLRVSQNKGGSPVYNIITPTRKTFSESTILLFSHWHVVWRRREITKNSQFKSGKKYLISNLFVYQTILCFIPTFKPVSRVEKETALRHVHIQERHNKQQKHNFKMVGKSKNNKANKGGKALVSTHFSKGF